MDRKDVIAYVGDLTLGTHFSGKQGPKLGAPCVPAHRALEEACQGRWPTALSRKHVIDGFTGRTSGRSCGRSGTHELGRSLIVR